MAIAVPAYVSEAAQRGLDWYAAGKAGDGVTDKTLREAHEMASGSVSEDKLRRMGPWFRRHRPDMDAPANDSNDKAFPGAGAVAWALWGGPTSGDIMRTADWVEAKVTSLDRENGATASAARLQTIPDTMPEIVITDIDGTILDDAHQPIEPVIDFIDAYDCEVVVVTNRPESEREKTLAELQAADVEPFRLYMNKDGSPAPEYKRGVVKELMDEGFDPQVFIDNRADVRDAVAELGVQVVNPDDIVNSSANGEDMSKITPEALASKLSADLSAITAERDTLVASASTVAAELTALKDGIASMTAERDALALKVKELEATALTASAKAAEMVAEKAASSVQAPLKITPAEQTAKLEGKDLVSAYLALNGAEQAKFFEANKAELFAARKAGIR